jgi:sulfide dehydrogenase cytochrome subunit
MKRGYLLFCAWLSVTPCYAELNAESIALMCRNCHTQQISANSVPSLSHLSTVQLQQLLLDYKYDKRAATLMPRLAKGYSDQELQAVAQLLGQH